MRASLASLALAGLLGGCVVAETASPPVPAAQVAPPPVPAERVEYIPPPPSAAVLWQPGEWHWNGVAYVWRPGHYIQRVAYYHHWVRGHWNGAGVWIPGHWV